MDANLAAANTGSRASGDIVVALTIAFAVTGLPVLMHPVSQAFALVLCGMLAVLVATYAVAAVPTALLCSYLFQNTFVAIISSSIETQQDFNAIRGYSFVTTATIWLVLSASYWRRPPADRMGPHRLMLWTTAILGLAFLYFLLGALSDVKSAAVYLRNITSPILIFQICLTASRHRSGLGRPLPALGLILLGYGYAELLVRAELFEIIDARGFFTHNMRNQILSGEFIKEMQETGRVIRDFEDMMKTDLFNSSLLSDLKVRIYRLQGPNFTPISFAYALSVFSLFRMAAGRPLYFIAALPLLIGVGSKGALTFALLPITALAIFGMTRARMIFAVFATFLVAYSIVLIVVGLRVGDYHVLGLMGGIKGFLANPIGYGIGIGGNLSTNMARMDWSRAQALGGTDFAVESAVGVLLYQMGIAGGVVCLVPLVLARRAWAEAVRTGRKDMAAVALGLLMVLVNGLFQEEAMFAPLALGTVMLFAGLIFGAAPGWTVRYPARAGRVAAPARALRMRPDPVG